MIQLTAQRIRFACDASIPFGTATDAITGAAIALPSGSALQLELAFYFGAGAALADANLLDLSVYSAVNIQFQDNADPHNGTVYYAGAVAYANINNALTTAQWNTKAAANAHITLFIPSAQNVVPPATTNYWICIYGISTDAAADPILLFATRINGKDSGIPANVAAMAGALKLGGKIPFVCQDGLTRDLTIGTGPNGIWITQVNQAGYNGAGQAAYSVLCPAASGGDNLYRDLTLQLQDGSYVLAVNQNGHA